MLRQQLFRPFKVFLASGHSDPVAGPEWMMVTGLTTAPGISGESADGNRVILMDNTSIPHAEPMDAYAGHLRRRVAPAAETQRAERT